MASDKLARAQLARAAQRFAARDLPPLVLMTDDTRLPDPRDAARNLPRGSLVILRGTARTDEIVAALLRLPLLVLIAGDAELAARTRAHGLHLPQARAREAAQWRARHPHWLITAAAHSLRATGVRAVDAVLLSPVFATASHPDAAPLGTIRARLIARQSPCPVYALGGIDAVNVRELADASFAGVAAIGALT